MDQTGSFGTLLHYGMVIALVGSAFLVFIYLWRKGRLDMDEEPKFQMMEENVNRSPKANEDGYDSRK